MPTQPHPARSWRATSRWLALIMLALVSLPAASPAAPRVPIPGLRSTTGFQHALGLREPGRPMRADAHRAKPAATARLDNVLARMIRAGDRIARLPYIYGGGHGSFAASGYDCSGSVSYVLHAGGLLATPEDSSGLASFGVSGPGRHVTIYTNPEHALILINGRRFDTIAFQETGTRWSSDPGSLTGYVLRHPRGL